jgi:hypothetical protein
MYGTRPNNTVTIYLIGIGIVLYLFMPKSVTFKVDKNVAIPVISTLTALSIFNNFRY